MSAAPQAVPVDAVVLNVLEERMCAVMSGIIGTSEAIGSMKDADHLEFVAGALFTALAEKMSQCFEVLSEGRLLKAEREIAEVAHAARA
jgi:hypothetical protein